MVLIFSLILYCLLKCLWEKKNNCFCKRQEGRECQPDGKAENFPVGLKCEQKAKKKMTTDPNLTNGPTSLSPRPLLLNRNTQTRRRGTRDGRAQGALTPRNS